MITRQDLDEILAEWFNMEIELPGGRTPAAVVKRSQIVEVIYNAITAGDR